MAKPSGRDKTIHGGAWASEGGRCQFKCRLRFLVAVRFQANHLTPLYVSFQAPKILRALLGAGASGRTQVSLSSHSLLTFKTGHLRRSLPNRLPHLASTSGEKVPLNVSSV